MLRHTFDTCFFCCCCCCFVVLSFGPNVSCFHTFCSWWLKCCALYSIHYTMLYFFSLLFFDIQMVTHMSPHSSVDKIESGRRAFIACSRDMCAPVHTVISAVAFWMWIHTPYILDVSTFLNLSVFKLWLLRITWHTGCSLFLSYSYPRATYNVHTHSFHSSASVITNESTANNTMRQSSTRKCSA